MCELLRQTYAKKLLLNLVMHSADVSSRCKPWKICKAWAIRVLSEFFAQGDLEKARGIPVQALNDRVKVNKPNTQIGFIEFIISPLMAAGVRFFPTLREFGDNICSNMSKWNKMWIEQYSPPAEEPEKVEARIVKAHSNMMDAKYRGHTPRVARRRRRKARVAQPVCQYRRKERPYIAV